MTPHIGNMTRGSVPII